MIDVGYVAAFLGGVLALISPCSALLLPSFFAYAFQQPGRLIARTSLFYLGLALTLVPLGVGSSFASRLFYGHREILIFLGWFNFSAVGLLLNRSRVRRRASTANPTLLFSHWVQYMA
jgi:cytochrome c biogenesis protein CcdA